MRLRVHQEIQNILHFNAEPQLPHMKILVLPLG